MPGLCERMKDWVTSPFTAVVKFQKDFVDEAKENLKRRKETYTRWQRELQERAIQLHLDELEGQFLCCVCGRPGEDRGEGHFASDTFSVVTLPTKGEIRRAVRVTEKALAAERRRKQREEQLTWLRATGRSDIGADGIDPDETESGSRSESGVSSPVVPTRTDGTPFHAPLDGAALSEEEKQARAQAKMRRRRERQRRRAKAREAGEERAVDRWGPQYAEDEELSSEDDRDENGRKLRDRGGDDDEDDSDDEDGHAARYRALLDPSTVGPAEIRTLMYNIRHAVLNKEARSKHTDEHARRDRGLTMLDDKEIDTFSRLFKRPLHGYLCDECHTSAKRRVETLTEEIRSLLFRADHPLLHKLQHRELYAWLSTGQISPMLAGAILQSQEQWERLHRKHHLHDADGGDGGSAPPAGQAPTSRSAEASRALMDAASRRLRQAIARANADEENRSTSATLEGELDVLPDDVITKLREFVKCGVCMRRHACFFVRSSVLFACQFCCARDRYYRDNAICINDEPIPAENRLLLCELAVYYETVHRQQHLRQLPQTELAEAPTGLFGPATHGDLFQLQAPDEAVRLVTSLPHHVPRGWRQRHPREAAARSMVTLFEGNTLVAGARAPLVDSAPEQGDSNVAVARVPLSLGASRVVELFDETAELGAAVSPTPPPPVAASNAPMRDLLARAAVPTDAPTAAVPSLDTLLGSTQVQQPIDPFSEAEAQAAREAEAQAAREAEAQAAHHAQGSPWRGGSTADRSEHSPAEVRFDDLDELQSALPVSPPFELTAEGVEPWLYRDPGTLAAASAAATRGDPFQTLTESSALDAHMYGTGYEGNSIMPFSWDSGVPVGFAAENPVAAETPVVTEPTDSAVEDTAAADADVSVRSPNEAEWDEANAEDVEPLTGEDADGHEGSEESREESEKSVLRHLTGPPEWF